MSACKQFLDFGRIMPYPPTNSHNKTLLNSEDGSNMLHRQVGNCLLVPEDFDPVIEFYIISTVHFLTFYILTMTMVWVV
jgi:hypothetical protein